MQRAMSDRWRSTPRAVPHDLPSGHGDTLERNLPHQLVQRHAVRDEVRDAGEVAAVDATNGHRGPRDPRPVLVQAEDDLGDRLLAVAARPGRRVRPTVGRVEHFAYAPAAQTAHPRDSGGSV